MTYDASLNNNYCICKLLYKSLLEYLPGVKPV